MNEENVQPQVAPTANVAEAPAQTPQPATTPAPEKVAEEKAAPAVGIPSVVDETGFPVVQSRFGKQEEKDVVINGTKVKFTLNYPGTQRALEIVEGARDADQSINTGVFAALLFQNKDVVINPAISDVKFFDTHDGFGQVIAAALTFLTDELY